MERNKAKCVEAGAVSSKTFLGLAGCPFPFAVMVTHLEGGRIDGGEELSHCICSRSCVLVFRTELR